MNDFLRLLGRLLRPFGYDIRRRGFLNLLPLKGISPASSANRVRTTFDHDGSQEPRQKPNLDDLKIIFRTCLTRDRMDKAAIRIDAIPMVDIVERCFSSLVSSVNAALQEDIPPRIELIILDDHSDEPYRDVILRVATRLKCEWTIQTTTDRWQGASLHQQFYISSRGDDLYYFCEDDYIHNQRAIIEMWLFYRQVFQSTGSHIIIHPQEHEALYVDSYYPSYLILSPYRHWRSVSDATHVLFTHTHVVRDYWSYFENTKYVGNYAKRRMGSERRTTNRLVGHIPFFAPIPALAGHLQAPHLLPPFFDWRALWNANAPD